MSEVDADQALRPRSWEEFVGQEGLKTRLDTHIRSALSRTRPLDHVLLATAPGMGKSTMAEVIASRLGDPFVAVSRPLTSVHLARVLQGLEAGVLFLDEVHRLPKATQEDLLPLLEDGYLDTQQGRVVLPWLTIIAATTEPEKIIPPLFDRFMIRPAFTAYSGGEMVRIVSGMALRAGAALSPETIAGVARAAGGVPRNARSLVVAARDLAEAHGTAPSTEDILALVQVDPDGLSQNHLSYFDLKNAAGPGRGFP